MKKFTIEMSDVIKKVSDQLPHRFLWFEIFLPANMAKAPDDNSAAVKAIFFFPFGAVAHDKFLLKIVQITSAEQLNRPVRREM